MNNAWSTPHVSGINLILDYDREPRTAGIRRVTLDRYRVKAGSTLTARVQIAPYRGADRVLTTEIEIPEETPPGPLTLRSAKPPRSIAPRTRTARSSRGAWSSS